MKVGILTYHDINNYGAQLQAASLQVFIDQQGHDCEIINYLPPRTRIRIFGTLLRLVLGFKFGRFIKELKRRNIFKSSIKKMARVGSGYFFTKQQVEKQCIQQKYDVLICGSDELWNFSNYLGYLEPYILDMDIVKARKLSYAASIGSYKKLPEIDARMKKSLRKFETILVRDANTSNFVSGLGFKSELVVDPTLIADLVPELPLEKDYLLITGGLAAYQIEQIKIFSQELDLRIITPGNVYPGLESSSRMVTPQQWIGLIKQAKYHITSLFHGAIFSIKYDTQFACYCTPGKEEKITHLLDTFGLKERLLPIDSSSENISDVVNCKFPPEFSEKKQFVILDSQRKLLAALS